MDLVQFILACYGLTMILMYGKIFNKIRPKTGFFGNLLTCSLCTGFWSGLFMWLVSNTSFNFFVAGCISAGTTYILDKIIDDDGLVIKKK